MRWRAGRNWLERIGQWVHARPLVVDSLLASAVAAPFAPWSLTVALRSAHLPWSVTMGVAVITGHGALAFRRVSPRLSFAVVSAACVLMTVVTDLFVILPSTVVFPLSLYAYCAYGRRSAPAAGLAVGLVGAVAMTARLTRDPQAANIRLFSLFLGGFLFAVVLSAWSLGLTRRIQIAYIAALEDRAVRAEAEREERARRAARDERARIAREMHDVIAHSLAVIVSQAQGGQYAARREPERAIAVLATIAEAGRQALADMRGLVGVLRTDDALNGEEGWTPQPTLRDLPALLDRVRGAGLTVQYHAVGPECDLGPTAELALYRVVQEALTNTMKHAGPGVYAAVQFMWTDDGLSLTVSDTGHGSPPRDGGGHGLIGMRERLAAVGGSVVAAPGPEGGFVVRAQLPCRVASRARG